MPTLLAIAAVLTPLAATPTASLFSWPTGATAAAYAAGSLLVLAGYQERHPG